jgi:hypothetical protein
MKGRGHMGETGVDETEEDMLKWIWAQVVKPCERGSKSSDSVKVRHFPTR